MRVSVALVGLICLFSLSSPAQNPTAPADAAKEPGSVEGRIVNALTGEPIRKANLTLMSMPSGGGTISAGPPPSVGAVSDAEGKFKFENLEPGRYTLSADKTGFVRQQYGAASGQVGPGTTLTMASGQKIKSLEFKLTPQAVISGKVVDEDGEPLARTMIQVLRQTAYSRRPMGMMGAQTNDVGEFRIASLSPGKYIIRADYRRGMFGVAAPPQAASGEGVEDYVTTFYAGTTDIAAAVPITARAGQEVSGLEIRLQKARVYRVRGKVPGITMDPSTRIQVSLEPQKRSNIASMVLGGGGNLKPDGSFELPSVLPGSYFVTALQFDQGRPQVLGRVPITVSNGNIDGVVIYAGAPLEIAGRVALEGDDRTRITGSVLLQPAGDGISFGSSPGRIQNDGTFKLENVSRDKYYVTVMGLPEGTYVKQVRAGDADVLENGIDLSQASSAPAVEILLGSKAATIEGIVRHEDKPWPGASITLLPEPLRPDRVRFQQKIGSSDQNGRFTLKGIAPGEYRLYAWEEYVPVAELEPEQLKAYEGYAVKIKLAEGAQEQVEVKLARPQQQ